MGSSDRSESTEIATGQIDVSATAPRGLDFRVLDVAVDRWGDDRLVWFAVGGSQPLRQVLGDSVSLDPTEAVARGTRIARSDRDAAFALADLSDLRSPKLHLWRGILSTHDWFIAENSGGRTFVSDDFRDVLAALPVADRSVNEDAIVQHYLYRTVYGTDTYLERIRRVGYGEHVILDIQTGDRTAEVFDRMASETESVSPGDYVSTIEDALEDALGRVRDHADTTQLMFSGGVDSTLLATFTGRDIPLVTVKPDTPEFAVETAYAHESSRLLDLPIDELVVTEDSYRQRLETVIGDSGRPPVHDIIPFLAAPYAANSGGTLVVGEGADGMFGTLARPARVANLLRQRHIRAAALGLARVAPSDVRTRAEIVFGRGALLAADPWSVDGYSARSQIYGDPTFIRGIVGQDRIDNILMANIEYMNDRVDLATPGTTLLQHLEISRWRDMFSDHIRIDKEVARAHGSSVYAPFSTSSVVSALTRIPVEARYYKGFTGKWILKEMLQARLPAYPIGKRKLYTSLPYMRFCTNGPMDDIWDHYGTPDLFEGVDRSRLLANDFDESVLWNAMSHAMWMELVVLNPNLEARVPTSDLSFEVAATA